MPAKTVLVLGAGASKGYGFPVGSELTRKILALTDDDAASDSMSFSKTAIREFVDAFRNAQTYSIDSFLGRRPGLVEIGKAAIAYILLSCEQKADLTNDTNDDHWYRHLHNELAADTWEKFDPSWLSIVTFNYDRSLQSYLNLALQHTYAKRPAEVQERLAGLKVAHVYGWLGDIVTGIPFGGLRHDLMDHYVREAAQNLVIVPEGRNDSQTVLAAQALIASAERVCFLGFGFDSTNIDRLGAPAAFFSQVENRHPRQVPKQTIATCMGLTFAERRRAFGQLFGGQGDPDHLTRDFYGKNCIQTLRESLILD